MSRRDILDLSNHVDKKIHVRFQGGREVIGVLKGYDQLVNIVLDETEEFIRDPENPDQTTDKTRKLGLTVCRGNSVTFVCPAEGFEKVANPFENAE
mmetsp:Transcript_9156/g.14869  ORF Transcript_9156/g.14869 Transcript_9156/m.14869 type:complete len:96 (+) Transcript_9156:69-356(+)